MFHVCNFDKMLKVKRSKCIVYGLCKQPFSFVINKYLVLRPVQLHTVHMTWVEVFRHSNEAIEVIRMSIWIKKQSHTLVTFYILLENLLALETLCLIFILYHIQGTMQFALVLNVGRQNSVVFANSYEILVHKLQV